nr:hypothetical protein [Tanacetum cinerariifolium]
AHVIGLVGRDRAGRGGVELGYLAAGIAVVVLVVVAHVGDVGRRVGAQAQAEAAVDNQVIINLAGGLHLVVDGAAAARFGLAVAAVEKSIIVHRHVGLHRGGGHRGRLGPVGGRAHEGVVGHVADATGLDVEGFATRFAGFFEAVAHHAELAALQAHHVIDAAVQVAVFQHKLRVGFPGQHRDAELGVAGRVAGGRVGPVRPAHVADVGPAQHQQRGPIGVDTAPVALKSGVGGHVLHQRLVALEVVINGHYHRRGLGAEAQ